MPTPYQAQPNGTIVQAVDFTTFNEVSELTNALTADGWHLDQHTPGLRGYHYFEISNNGTTFRLHVYLKKVNWRNRSEYEKAAQFPADHVHDGYQVAQTGQEKTVVFGVYKPNAAETLICAWDPFEWGTRDHAFNCFIDVRALAQAFVFGFARDASKNDRNVYAFRSGFIHYYIANKELLHQGQPPQAVLIPPAAPDQNIPRNKIIYGAPGTGKSFELREQAGVLGFDDAHILRVTFHPSYTYQQFVGSYKPVPIYKAANGALYKSDRITAFDTPYDKEPLIDYAFVAGPFMTQLAAALLAPAEPFLLIIEEINRANVAAVFGDIFQLLDRNVSGASEYHIDLGPEADDFLRTKGLSGKALKLPANLFIWSTMNSADQGVMPLDAAFKRRWAFEYLPLDAKAAVISTRTITFQGRTFNWNAFRQAINERLKAIPVSEDKLIGPFFMNSAELNSELMIKNKLLLYLRDDILRHNPENLFLRSTFSDIIADYDNGQEIFNDFVLPAAVPVAAAAEEAGAAHAEAAAEDEPAA